MKYTLSIKVVARCPSAAVELNPDGLSEWFSNIGALISNLRDMTKHHFPGLTVEVFEGYFDRLRVEGELFERLVAGRPKAGRKKKRQKSLDRKL